MTSKKETRRELASRRASESVLLGSSNSSEVSNLAFRLQQLWLSSRLRVSQALVSAIAELACSNERRSA
jgi:hypothetical protein